MRQIPRLLAVALLGLSGCAGAYHAYPGCAVPYGYRPPPPPPYVNYRGCPTPVAVRFAAGELAASTPAAVDGSAKREIIALAPFVR
jgi:hypothetical protein